MAVGSRVDNADSGEFPVLFIKVDPVADNEFVGDNKPGVGNSNGVFTAFRFVEQCENLHGRRMHLLKIIGYALHRKSAVDNVFDKQNMSILNGGEFVPDGDGS